MAGELLGTLWCQQQKKAKVQTIEYCYGDMRNVHRHYDIRFGSLLALSLTYSVFYRRVRHRASKMLIKILDLKPFSYPPQVENDKIRLLYSGSVNGGLLMPSAASMGCEGFRF